MATRRELAQEQLDLMNEIRANANINMVTCGHCGTVLLHNNDLEFDKEPLVCFGCGIEHIDASSCPDYWYEGLIENQEFDEDEECTDNLQNKESVSEEDTQKELAIVVAYFQSIAFQYGSFFDTIDESIRVANLFVVKFKDTLWGIDEDLEYEEILYKFFDENFKHKNKL